LIAKSRHLGRLAKTCFLAVGAALCAVLALAAASTAATLPPASAPAVASQGVPAAGNDCASLKKKARRARRGSAKRRRYMRRYRRCLARTRVPNPPPVQAPSTPTPPAVTQPAGPIYLPSIFPNPNGYRSGAGCQLGYEQSYRAAGFSCQYAGYNHYVFSPTGPIWTPVYLLFGIWYCADGQFRFRC
jgi:hypothetical protein